MRSFGLALSIFRVPSLLRQASCMKVLTLRLENFRRIAEPLCTPAMLEPSFPKKCDWTYLGSRPVPKIFRSERPPPSSRGRAWTVTLPRSDRRDWKAAT
jgi:hypothetical protein